MEIGKAISFRLIFNHLNWIPSYFFQVLQGYVFELSSQQWLDESIYYIKNYGEGSVIWKHWVNVWVPKDRKIDKELLDSAILFIDGGSNSASEKPPRSAENCTIINQTLRSMYDLR